MAWVGHYDLTISMGIPTQFEHPRFLDAMDAMVAACHRHGVAPGFLPPTPEAAMHWIKKGFRVISLGSDIGVFLDGIRRFRAGVVPPDNAFLQEDMEHIVDRVLHELNKRGVL